MRTLLILFTILFFCSPALAQTRAENIAQAQLLHKNKAYKKERQFLTQCIKKDKYFAEYYFLRAECNYELYEVNDAFSDIDRAVNLGTDSLKYRITKAEYHESVLQSSRFHKSEYVIEFDLALKTLKEGLPLAKNAKDSCMLIEYMGMIREEMGDTVGALKDLYYAISLDNTSIDALNNLAMVYSDLDSTKLCLFYAQKALALDTSDAFAHNTIAIAYMNIPKYDSAIHYLDRCIVLDSIESLRTGWNDGVAYDNRSSCKLEIGDTKGALHDAQRAIEIDPTNSHAYFNLAMVYEKMGEKGKACEALDKALSWGYTEYSGDYALKMKARLCGE